MKKVLLGVAAAVGLAALGYLGFTFYAKHRALAEVEAAFERMRSNGSKASHGEVTYDPWKRTLAVADISVETGTQPPVTLRIASLSASGVGQSEPGRISADDLEGTDVQMSFALALGGTQLQYTYTLPKLNVTNLSGPIQAEQPPAAASALDFYRFGMAQFSRLAASSVTIPTLSVAMKLNSPGVTDSDVTYSGIGIEGIKDGKIASAKIEKANIAQTMQIAGKRQSFTGTFTNMLMDQFDAAAVVALLDPQKSDDEAFYQMYRRISVEAYDIKSPPLVNVHFGPVALDDLAVQPSRVQLPALLAAMPKAGTTPSPAQTREMMEKVAGIYDGLRIGNFELSGISIDTPQGPARLQAIRFNMGNGKSDISVDQLDAPTPQGPLKAARFAIKALDFGALMRLSASMQPSGQKPPAEAALALFQIVQGAEVKDLVAPTKELNKPVSIDRLNIDWGQFVGPIPTQIHLSTKMTTPVAASDPRLQPLLAAGIQSTRINADIGAGWTETSGTIALEPATVEIAGLAKAQARLSLTNVPRALFDNPQQAAVTAGQIETGAIEFTLHDLGVVDILVNQYARSQNVSHDAARTAMLDAIKTNGAQAAGASPDAAAAVAAIGRFVETPQQTLVIKLTPIGKLPAMVLFQLLKSDPMAALAQFKIDASTGSLQVFVLSINVPSPLVTRGEGTMTGSRESLLLRQIQPDVQLAQLLLRHL